MFKVQDQVKLLVDNPEGNGNLLRSSLGTIIDVNPDSITYLVCWEDFTSNATVNDKNIKYYASILDPEEKNTADLFDIYSGHLWWVKQNQIEKLGGPFLFRKKKRTEPQLEYKLAKKIYELDFKWKEKQNAKTNSLSL